MLLNFATPLRFKELLERSAVSCDRDLFHYPTFRQVRTTVQPDVSDVTRRYRGHLDSRQKLPERMHLQYVVDLAPMIV